MSATDMTLEIGGSLYRGWKQIQIATGIEQLAGQFTLNCADRWAIQGEALPMLEGQPCTVSIAGVPVITGTLDETETSFDPGSHDLTLAGRDATGDLVDCAAEVDGRGWQGRTLEQVAIELCKPFGIAVTVDSEPGNGRNRRDKGGKVSARSAFRAVHINPGETIFETLSRAAQLRGYLLVSDGIGGLRITRAGAAGRARTVLTQGVNVTGGRARRSQAERFHTYKVYGQANESDTSGATSQQLLGRATDPAIRKARVTAIHTSDDNDQVSATMLAQWHAANRLARGLSADLQVRGWLDGDRPWAHNATVEVDVPWLRLKGELLIAGVSFSLDDRGGEVAVLSLTPVNAFVPEPLNDSTGAAFDAVPTP